MRVEGHDRLFRRAFRLAHHRDGVYRLVGRDEHEAPDAVRGRELGQRACRLRVVAPRLLGIELAHRHVLVCGRVKDDLGPVRRQERRHLVAVVHVDHERHERRDRLTRAHLAVDLVERVFTAFDHQDFPRARRRHLADDLAADGTARARHHHALAGEEAHGRAVVEMAHRAREQLLVVPAGEQVGAPEDAQADDADRREEERDQRHGIRRAHVRERGVGHEDTQQRQEDAREARRAEVARQVADADAPPREAVAAAEEERGEIDRQHDEIGERGLAPAERRLVEVEAQRERREVGDADRERVDRDADEPRREEERPRSGRPRHVRTRPP